MSITYLLSLGTWSIKSQLSNNYKISPVTKKIIKNTKINLQQILPITYNQFVLENHLDCRKKQENQQLYHSELSRREKKIQILQEIWKNIKNIKSKSAHKNQQYCYKQKKYKDIKKQNHAFKTNSKSFYIPFNKIQRKSKSPLIFNAKSPTYKNQAYFDYYNKQSLKNIKKHTNYQEQSTKTRRQKTLTSHSKSKQLFNSSKSKKNSIKIIQNKNQKIFKEINTIVQKWSELQIIHSKELEEMNQLTDKEKKRLLKIHFIEKEKLKNQITDLKSTSKEHKKSQKHIL